MSTKVQIIKECWGFRPTVPGKVALQVGEIIDDSRNDAERVKGWLECVASDGSPDPRATLVESERQAKAAK